MKPSPSPASAIQHRVVQIHQQHHVIRRPLAADDRLVVGHEKPHARSSAASSVLSSKQ